MSANIILIIPYSQYYMVMGPPNLYYARTEPMALPAVRGFHKHA